MLLQVEQICAKSAKVTTHDTDEGVKDAMDWLNELRFNVPLDTKKVILETLFPDNLLAST